jgi:hypothetical protein
VQGGDESVEGEAWKLVTLEKKSLVSEYPDEGNKEGRDCQSPEGDLNGVKRL